MMGRELNEASRRLVGGGSTRISRCRCCHQGLVGVVVQE